MEVNRADGSRLLGAALLLGGLGDWLFRRAALGLNGFLWMLLLLAAVLYFAPPEKGFGAARRWLLLPALLFAALLMWRDSTALRLLDLLLIAVTLALALTYPTLKALREAGIGGYVKAGFFTGVQAALGLLPVLISDVRWSEMPRNRATRHAAAVLRGLLIAVPLLWLFGSLLMSADALFEAQVRSIVRVDMENLTIHLVTALFWAWLAAGLLRTAVRTPPPDLVATRLAPSRLTLGAVEMGLVLGLLNLLFLAFVLVQFRYFFGGAALVADSLTLTYAEYARRGFFELVWVCALTLPLLLLLDQLLPTEAPDQIRLFRWLSAAMLLLLGVIGTSAMGRMLLYQREYGLTELRLYTSAFMLWVGVLLVLFAATVLRGRKERFAFGALVSGCAVVLALHGINPDWQIARVNLERAAEGGRPLDIHYLSGLGADAAPVLAAALPGLPEDQRGILLQNLEHRWGWGRQVDWRSWNYARARAVDQVRAIDLSHLKPGPTLEAP